MKEQLQVIREQAQDFLGRVASMKELEDLRLKFLGKKGDLTAILKNMGKLGNDQRAVVGQLANDLRKWLEDAIADKKQAIAYEDMAAKLAAERIDVTMPGKALNVGHRHPMTIVMEEIKDLFIGMGFEIAEGPDIETDYYNFEALNIPANHPAKDEQDTFYIGGNLVLRTQTSPVQVRTMEQGNLPIRVIAPGKVFRSDAVDATHSPVFHQVEGLVIDKGVTMGDLRGVLELFAKSLLGENVKVRFRPHHFPFTEPSAEMDVSCFSCGGTGCRICKDSGWIELLGCGMVHPKVLQMSGIDPLVYSGYAFGMGLERIAMQRYNITDMRLLFENDERFLKQFI